MVNSFNFTTLVANTPTSPLTGELLTGWGNTKGTSCCYKLSHGLNLSGYAIPARSHRRANHQTRIGGVLRYHLMVVDEVEKYLDDTLKWSYENIKDNGSGGSRTQQEQINYLQGKCGVLLFWTDPYGLHVELWNKNRMHQPGMSSQMFTISKSVWLYETSVF